MAISIVRLGSARKSNEGVRLGTVRRPPRGVPKTQFAKLNYYDVWLPLLSPSAELVTVALHAADAKAWAGFERRFRAEMKHREAASVLDTLAALSHQTN